MPCMMLHFMLHFMHANNLGTLSFLQKEPAGGGEAIATAKIVTKLNAKQKLFSTRRCTVTLSATVLVCWRPHKKLSLGIYVALSLMTSLHSESSRKICR